MKVLNVLFRLYPLPRFIGDVEGDRSGNGNGNSNERGIPVDSWEFRSLSRQREAPFQLLGDARWGTSSLAQVFERLDTERSS
jgi:hypothetical protein